MDPSLARQFYRIIEDQADRLKELVSDLLDVARIEMGALPVSPEPAQLTLIVERARSAFSGAWRRESAGDRHRAGPSPGAGRPAAHRPGAGQPAGQRGPPLPAYLDQSG